MGQTGFVLNCVAGIGLLVLALTGAVLGWPGLKLWTRGLRINLRANWKRITYDSHNLLGIATLAIVAFRRLTAIDFLWPTQTAGTVAFFSPLQGMRKPKLPKPATIRVPHSFAPKKTQPCKYSRRERVGSAPKALHRAKLDPKPPGLSCTGTAISAKRIAR